MKSEVEKGSHQQRDFPPRSFAELALVLPPSPKPITSPLRQHRDPPKPQRKTPVKMPIKPITGVCILLQPLTRPSTNESVPQMLRRNLVLDLATAFGRL